MQDLEQLLMFYPYLKNPFSYDCSADPHEQNRAPYTPGVASAIMHTQPASQSEDPHAQDMRSMPSGHQVSASLFPIAHSAAPAAVPPCGRLEGA